MLKARKTVWRTTPDAKDLLSLEQRKIAVHIFDATPEDLVQLRAAIDEVLMLIEDPTEGRQPAPASV